MIETRTPIDADYLLGWLAARAIPGVEAVDLAAGVYARTVADGVLRATVRPDGTVAVEREADRAAAARILDLDADTAAIDAALARDPALAPLVAARPGLRVPGCLDPFELTVRAVLGQQVSVAAASTVAGRLVGLLGDPLDHPQGPLTHRFPAPEVLAAAEIPFVPAARGRALRAVAAAAAAGALDPRDPGALQRLPGIGPWTAGYVAMRAGRDRDAFPPGDLVLNRMLERTGAEPERWRPFRAYGAMHLWAAAAGGGG
ncbi:MAG TPA: AlkA N-terminal domain-containing protein [Capillimicrobium sp.]